MIRFAVRASAPRAALAALAALASGCKGSDHPEEFVGIWEGRYDGYYADRCPLTATSRFALAADGAFQWSFATRYDGFDEDQRVVEDCSFPVRVAQDELYEGAWTLRDLGNRRDLIATIDHWWWYVDEAEPSTQGWALGFVETDLESLDTLLLDWATVVGEDANGPWLWTEGLSMIHRLEGVPDAPR